MTGSRCAQLRQAIGVYVLGAIDPAERAELDAHLAECSACRDELAGLAGLPALLGRVSEDQLHEAAGEPDSVLLDRVLVRVAARRRRDRRRTWLATAAAVLVAVLLAGGGTWALRGELAGPPVAGDPSSRAAPTAPSVAPSLSASDPDSRVSAAVGIVPKAWGTAVTARLSGLPQGTSCKLVAVGAGGDREVAASWQVTYRERAVFEGSTGIHADELTQLEVVTDEGERLLVIPAR